MPSRIRMTLPTHPRTGALALGLRRDGRPVWPIAGGSETAGTEGATAGGQAGGQSGGQSGGAASGGQASGQGGSGQQAGQSGGQSADQNTGWDGKVESLPDGVQKMIRDLRSEAAGNRTKASEVESKQQEMLDGIAKALGLKADEAPDPAKLQASIAEKDKGLIDRDTTIRTQAIELATWRAASKPAVGADTSSLLDSRSFVETVSKLDPAADDFQTKLDAAIKKAVEDNPKLRATQAAARGGAEFSGGPGGEAKPNTLEAAVEKHFAGATT